MYHWQLSIASFHFCEIHLLHIKPFVAKKSANFPFLGGEFAAEISVVVAKSVCVGCRALLTCYRALLMEYMALLLQHKSLLLRVFCSRNRHSDYKVRFFLKCVAVCCSVLQYVAVCCSVCVKSPKWLQSTFFLSDVATGGTDLDYNNYECRVPITDLPCLVS